MSSVIRLGRLPAGCQWFKLSRWTRESRLARGPVSGARGPYDSDDIVPHVRSQPSSRAIGSLLRLACSNGKFWWCSTMQARLPELGTFQVHFRRGFIVYR